MVVGVTFTELLTFGSFFTLCAFGFRKGWGLLKFFGGLYGIFLSFSYLVGSWFFWLLLGFSVLFVVWGAYDAV